mmetsp:Transcript_16095/g.19959  ORF Transcript_16095/g.19959 Transcript_16095/m.19959 type:complete len:114 (-) Transcript_16095:182-523(-)
MFQSSIGWFKSPVKANNNHVSFTLPTCQLPTGWLKAKVFLNMMCILMSLLLSHLDILPLNGKRKIKPFNQLENNFLKKKLLMTSFTNLVFHSSIYGTFSLTAVETRHEASYSR